MTAPFTLLWAQLRPADDADAPAWTTWPGPVLAAATARWEDRTVYGSLSFTTPHRLTVIDAADGERLAPPVLCAAQPDAFTLLATEDGLLAAGPAELLDPIERDRFGYPEDEWPENVQRLTAVNGADEPLLVTAEAFGGLKLWDLGREECTHDLPLPDLGTDTLCAGLIEQQVVAIMGKGTALTAYDLVQGAPAPRWTVTADARILRSTWALGLIDGRDAVVTADSAGRARTWEPATGRSLTPAAQLPGNPLHLSALALDVQGATLPLAACAYGDGACLVRLDTGQTLLDLRAAEQVRTAHLTGDGLLLLGTDVGPLALRIDLARLDLDGCETTSLDLTSGQADGRAGGSAADRAPSHGDLVELWGEDQVVTLDGDLLGDGLPATVLRTLAETGVPLAPLPGLTLDGDLELDGLARLEEVGVGPEDPDDPEARHVPEGMDGYHWLGTWHDDDLVLSPAGAVEAIGPDTDYEQPLLVNSDLASFVAFAYRYGLVALQQQPDYDPDLAEARTELLQGSLRAIDPAAFAEDGSQHWADALSDLEAGF